MPFQREIGQFNETVFASLSRNQTGSLVAPQHLNDFEVNQVRSMKRFARNKNLLAHC